MRDFIEAVRTGSVPETVGSENIKSLAMVVAAIDEREDRERVLVRSQEIS
jgi:hypothetical protein